MSEVVVMFPPRAGASVRLLLQLQAEFPSVKSVLGEFGKLLGIELSVGSLALETCARDGYCGQLLEQAAAIGLFHALIESGIEPTGLAVHCLGVYTALPAAGCLSVCAGFELLRRHMETLLSRPGELSTIINVPVEEVACFCESLPGLELSTINSDSLCTVSGTLGGLIQVEAWTLQRGGRFRRLSSFGAWHCSANVGLQSELLGLAELHVENDAKLPIWFPLSTPRKVHKRSDVIQAVVEQATSPVQWRDFLVQLLADPEVSCIEVGPISTLAKFHPPSDPLRSRIRTFRDQDELAELAQALTSSANVTGRSRPVPVFHVPTIQTTEG